MGSSNSHLQMENLKQVFVKEHVLEDKYNEEITKFFKNVDKERVFENMSVKPEQTLHSFFTLSTIKDGYKKKKEATIKN